MDLSHYVKVSEGFKTLWDFHKRDPTLITAIKKKLKLELTAENLYRKNRGFKKCDDRRSHEPYFIKGVIAKKMLTKANIEHAKLNPDSLFFKDALAPTREEAALLSMLDNLGKLPAGFNGDLFIPLLTHANSKIRMLAAKNVGKLKDEKFLTELSQLASTEKNTFARREAISAIGRIRSENAIPILTQYLTDADPKVILQALRGLLYFKEKAEVQTALDALREHPNELIREHLASEVKDKRDRAQSAKKDRHHPVSPDTLKNVIIHADVQEALKVIPDESIHLTFTSPPYYNARDYTIYQSYEAYLNLLTAIFKETHRITKEGRFLVLNTSPIIVPRISRAHSSKRYAIPYDIHPRLTDIGWEFIDDIVWTKPDYAVKNRNGGFFQHRKPLGYKANSVTENVMVYRKKTDKLIDWNIRQYDDETIDASKVMGDYEKTNLWHINPATDKVHPAVFPPELAARIVRFYSFKGDLVFDPFGGSGTVGYVALTHERYFFLCEKEAEYIERSKQLLNVDLFTDAKPQVLSLTELKSVLAERN